MSLQSVARGKTPLERDSTTDKGFTALPKDTPFSRRGDPWKGNEKKEGGNGAITKRIFILLRHHSALDHPASALLSQLSAHPHMREHNLLWNLPCLLPLHASGEWQRSLKKGTEVALVILVCDIFGAFPWLPRCILSSDEQSLIRLYLNNSFPRTPRARDGWFVCCSLQLIVINTQLQTQQ